MFCLGVYLATMARTVPAGDSGELISAAWTWGVAHPPGYPLFTMLGGLITHLSPAGPAFSMNLFSVITQVGAVALVGLLIARVLVPGWPRGDSGGRGTVAAVTGALTLAFSTAFWTYGLVAEVFALNDLFAAALLLLGIEWFRTPERHRLLWGIGLLSGLGFAHQQTISLLGPALLFLIWVTVQRVRSKRTRKNSGPPVTKHITIGLGLLVVGLLPYLYLPIAASADPAVNWGDPTTVDRFVDVVSREHYGTLSLVAGEETGSVVENLGLLFAYFWRAFTPIGVALAALGGAALWRKRRIEAYALGLAFIFTGPFFVAFAAAPLDDSLTRGILERFYILPSLPLAVFLGAGVWAILVWAFNRWDRPGVVSAAALSLVLPAVGFGLHLESADQSDNRVAANYARDILEPLEFGALLLVRGDHNYFTLLYAQEVDGVRPDVVTAAVELLKLPGYAEQIDRENGDISIPFASYLPGSNSLTEVVSANIDRLPVYHIGEMPEDLSTAFDELRAGLVKEFAPPGTEPDEYRLLTEDPTLVETLDLPADDYPETSWEHLISGHYANAVFDLGFALHADGRTEGVADLYREAIRLGEIPSAYKNLGVLLRATGGSPEEIVRVFERFLELEPNDRDAPAIRTVIAELKAEPGFGAGDP